MDCQKLDQKGLCSPVLQDMIVFGQMVWSPCSISIHNVRVMNSPCQHSSLFRQLLYWTFHSKGLYLQNPSQSYRCLSMCSCGGQVGDIAAPGHQHCPSACHSCGSRAAASQQPRPCWSCLDICSQHHGGGAMACAGGHQPGSAHEQASSPAPDLQCMSAQINPAIS